MKKEVREQVKKTKNRQTFVGENLAENYIEQNVTLKSAKPRIRSITACT